jgi:glycosyltransferase involved in cell wall biosynthesis
MKNLKIGVVIATYNGEKYIAQQLQSIIEQTRKPDIIVVSDGGSIDSTVAICREVLSKCDDITSIILTSEKQLNVSANFQKGIMNCNADYVFFADQDDVWKPDKIKVVIDSMINTDAAFAFTDAVIVDENLNSMGTCLWETVGYQQSEDVREIPVYDDQFMKLLLKRNIVTGMCMCLRKDFIECVVPFDLNVLHDKWIAMYAALSVKTIALNEKLVKYRQHTANVVGTKTDLKKMLKNRTKYYENVFYRKEMLERIASRIRITDTSVSNLIEKSISFHKNRLAFMDRKKNIIWPLKHKKEYKINESGYISIIAKDYIARFIRRNKRYLEI